MIGGVDEIINELRQRPLPAGLDVARFEAFLRLWLANDLLVAFYYTTATQRDAARPPALLDLFVLGRNRLHVFTAYSGGAVSAGTLGLSKIGFIQIVEDSQAATVTFSAGSGGGARLTGSISDPLLFQFVRAVSDAAWP
jgi:hypothetical protein